MVRANRMVSGKYQFRKIPCSCKKGMAKEIAILRDEKSTLLAALEKAVERYGKPGGPWNVPSEPGTWIADARAAIAKAKGEGA